MLIRIGKKRYIFLYCKVVIFLGGVHMLKKKMHETGRSMVEMLGVLAIMGVLTVVGIATYQYAFNAYQAGHIQDVIGNAKVLAQTDNRLSHVREVNRLLKMH